MLSKTKLTFSLTSFVVLIAFGLVCFAPSVFADGDVKKTHFDLGRYQLAQAESMIDVDARGTAKTTSRSQRDRDRRFRVFLPLWG